MKRITILFPIIILTFLFTLSAFALTKEEQAWKEDILTLLPLVKRVGDYSEVVELIEVAPALKEDPEIRKAFVTSAPPGATPPEWAREEEITSPVNIEVPEKIAIAEAQKEQRRREKTAGAETTKQKERREREEEARRIAQEVAAQRKIVTAETAEKVSRWESEQVSREEQRVRPTPLPKGAKVIHSTDVVSGVRVEMVEGKMRVIITLSGERKYTISDRAQPPSIIIDIPHTINAVSPGRIVVNQGGVRTIEVIQHRLAPVGEVRVTIRLSRFKEYEVKGRNNEIYVEFEK